MVNIGDPAPRALAVLPDRDSPMPLWAQVSADIRRRCHEGTFDDGVPGELALADEYAVSRHTIREALRALRAEGMISSQRGRGSVVRSSGFSQSLGAVYSLFRSVEAQGSSQTSDVLRLGVTTHAAAARRLGLDDDARLVVLERVRRADGEPLAYDTSWLPHTLAHPILDVDFRHTALYDELATRIGIRVDAGMERIAATVPGGRVAGLLGMAAGAATLFVERLATAEGRPVEWRETHVRGDRFTVESHWTASSAPTVSLATTPDPTAESPSQRTQAPPPEGITT